MGIDMSGTELTWRLYVIRDRVGFYAEIQIFFGTVWAGVGGGLKISVGGFSVWAE